MELHDVTKPPIGMTAEEASTPVPAPEAQLRAPRCRCSLVPLAPDSGWPQLPEGYVAYDVTYEIDVADRTPRKQP